MSVTSATTPMRPERAATTEATGKGYVDRAHLQRSGKRNPKAWLFLLLVLTYLTTYYFVFPHARYRHPIEPELLILMVFLISEAKITDRLS